MIGGPFSADIEQIIRDRAFLTQSPVISACDTGIKSITKCIDWDNGKPYQCCDISIKISNDMPLVSYNKSPHLFHLKLINSHLIFKSSDWIVQTLLFQSIELHDVNLQLLGDHQRHNAVTASCTALCLRNLGNDAIMAICWHCIHPVSSK